MLLMTVILCNKGLSKSHFPTLSQTDVFNCLTLNPHEKVHNIQ